MAITSFKVSAKTARLIGRENITDSDGALVELIKNGYDADATEIVLIYDMLYPTVPEYLEISNLDSVFSSEEIQTILGFYNDIEGSYIKKETLTDGEETLLFDTLTKHNRIILIDNGHGMDESILTTKWMNIGTDDKAIHKISPKGRVKTGAKGIGRFALDKLSRKTTVITKEKNDNTIKWKIDWTNIDKSEAIEDVFAEYNVLEKCFSNCVLDILKEYRIESIVSNVESWSSGTIILLDKLRENWPDRIFRRINRNLETLNPIGTPEKFDIYVRNIHKRELSFQSSSHDIDNGLYDYKILAEFDGKQSINISLKRNELDTSFKEVSIEVAKEFSVDRNTSEFWQDDVFKIAPFCYDELSKDRNFVKNTNDILDEDLKNYANKIGPFSMELYFMKSSNSDIPISKRFNATKRKKLLDSFSGIKIYRDNFKVRPYGEKGGTSYDWLNLGERQQKSPAAASHRSGLWRVQPYQLIGSINIGRDSNPFLKDMANRESLSSNDVFLAFKKIIISVINEFEFDRQFFYREYAKWTNDIIKENEQFSAEEVIAEILNENSSNEYDKEEFDEDEQTSEDSLNCNNYKETTFKYKETIKQLHQSNQDDKKELAFYRAFSASGIIANTFSHELKGLQTSLLSIPQGINVALKYTLKDIPKESLGVYDPFPLIDDLKSNNNLLKSWVDVIMSTIDNSDSEVAEALFNDVCNQIVDEWKALLDKKSIAINVQFQKDFYINMSVGDIYVILNNFLLNSSWFLDRTQGRIKQININVEEENSFLKLSLFNNGIEIDEQYKENPNKVFEIRVSSKVLDNGKKGTGLGMFLIKDTVEKNGGKVSIDTPEIGFGITILLPLERSVNLND